MNEFSETADDLKAAFEDLRNAGGDKVRHRRALKATLNELFRVREYRNSYSNGQFYPYAETCNEGLVTLGIVYLRGVLTHHVTKAVGPRLTPLYPSGNLQPSRDLFPGANYAWISAIELARVHPHDHRSAARARVFYESHVADNMMLSTLRQAIDFLMDDPSVVTFKPS